MTRKVRLVLCRADHKPYVDAYLEDEHGNILEHGYCVEDGKHYQGIVEDCLSWLYSAMSDTDFYLDFEVEVVWECGE
ncbi:MAG: hypothetical protein QXY39_01725 [Thermofilaceae archaeon]